MIVSKAWKIRAEKFAKYYRDDDNKDRHILATIGSAGYTFGDDIELLCAGLKCIGENEIAEKIEKEILGRG